MPKYSDDSAPRGRTEVEAALKHTVTELLAERKAEQITVRDIAGYAGVNHGLVHQYFGSKAGALRAAIYGDASGLADAVRSGDDLRTSTGALLQEYLDHPSIARGLAGGLLGGREPADLLEGSPRPGLAELMDVVLSLPDTKASDVDRRASVAAIGALIYGWVVFSDYLVHITGLREVPQAEVRAGIDRAIASIVAAIEDPEPISDGNARRHDAQP